MCRSILVGKYERALGRELMTSRLRRHVDEEDIYIESGLEIAQTERPIFRSALRSTYPVWQAADALGDEALLCT